MLERELVTGDWSRHVDLSILVNCLVDTRQIFKKMTYADARTAGRETQKDFYGHLAAELTNNSYDHIGGRWQEIHQMDPLAALLLIAQVNQEVECMLI
jgi:hypothetical protein